jgi:hypothetical protein
MGASARESRVSIAIYSLDIVGRPGLHQSGLTSLCFVGCFFLGPRKNDLTIHWALGPFVRSFTPLVDPGDIYPPHAVSHPPPTGQEQVPQDEAHGGCCDEFVRDLGRRLPVSFGLLDRCLLIM